MKTGDSAALADRVVVLTPTRKDELTTTGLLQDAGISVATFRSFSEIVPEIDRGAAVVVLPEESIAPTARTELVHVLRNQPPWSDLPLLVLTRTGADSAVSHDAVRTLGNVTLL